VSADTPRKGLGKGLSALFGTTAPQPVAPIAAPTPGGGGPRAATLIPIGAIEPGRYQPRRIFDAEEIASLADSIRTQGVLQPILVRRVKGDPQRYELVAGERRWRAAQAARLHEIPAVIKDLSDRETLEAALVENLQRQDLSPLEEAEAYRRLGDEFGHTQEEIGRALGRSRAHVANTLRLLSLPPEIQVLLSEGKLDAGHARVLIGARAPLELARRIIAEGLTVRQAEALAREAKAPSAKKKLKAAGEILRDADTRAIERRLEQSTGLKVKLQHTKDSNGGSVTFHYTTLEQFDALLAKLSE
jgi:ParB family chromosome partitioning protein